MSTVSWHADVGRAIHLAGEFQEKLGNTCLLEGEGQAGHKKRVPQSSVLKETVSTSNYVSREAEMVLTVMILTKMYCSIEVCKDQRRISHRSQAGMTLPHCNIDQTSIG